MEKFRPSRRLWLLCLAAAALNWGLDAVVLTMGLLTVGGPVPWRGLLLCYAAAQLLVELPLTPGGLGLVEGGLVEVLIRFHVSASRATAGTLMYRAVSYWFLLVVGWVAVGVPHLPQPAYRPPCRRRRLGAPKSPGGLRA